MAMDINDVTKKLTDIAIKIKNEEIQELLIALRIHISEISAENTKLKEQLATVVQFPVNITTGEYPKVENPEAKQEIIKAWQPEKKAT